MLLQQLQHAQQHAQQQQQHMLHGQAQRSGADGGPPPPQYSGMPQQFLQHPPSLQGDLLEPPMLPQHASSHGPSLPMQPPALLPPHSLAHAPPPYAPRLDPSSVNAPDAYSAGGWREPAPGNGRAPYERQLEPYQAVGTDGGALEPLEPLEGSRSPSPSLPDVLQLLGPMAEAVLDDGPVEPRSFNAGEESGSGGAFGAQQQQPGAGGAQQPPPSQQQQQYGGAARGTAGAYAGIGPGYGSHAPGLLSSGGGLNGGMHVSGLRLGNSSNGSSANGLDSHVGHGHAPGVAGYAGGQSPPFEQYEAYDSAPFEAPHEPRAQGFAGGGKLMGAGKVMAGGRAGQWPPPPGVLPWAPGGSDGGVGSPSHAGGYPGATAFAHQRAAGSPNAHGVGSSGW